MCIPFLGIADHNIGIHVPDYQVRTSETYYSSAVYFGGSIGMNPFQNGFTANINPILGFRVARRLHLGISAGINYQYEQIDFANVSSTAPKYNYQAINYDLSVFSRYFFFYRFFLHLEPEIIGVKQTNSIVYDPQNQSFTEDYERLYVPATLVGLGYAQPLGEQSILVLTVLYDAIQDENTPYNKWPFLRGGFNLGF